MHLRSVLPVFVLTLAACGGGATGSAAPPAISAPMPNATTSAAWAPKSADTFQWQLSSPVDTTIAATVYDIDAFDNAASVVSALHAAGRHVVCNVNTGAYENWRPDASAFTAHPEIIGNPYQGWPGEYWIDIRRLDVIEPIMQARFDMCKSKGFDAIEPDNMEDYQESTGFPLSASDQLTYNQWIAQQAHARGLSVALKNDSGQVAQLQPQFDFVIAEDCWYYSWCSAMKPFTDAGKVVFTVEYTDLTTSTTFHQTVCPAATSASDTAILKHRPLDSWRDTCP